VTLKKRKKKEKKERQDKQCPIPEKKEIYSSSK